LFFSASDLIRQASKLGTPRELESETRALPHGRELARFSPMRLEPKSIEQIGSELAIQWSDESETFLPLRFLRTACPCAACGGEPDVMGEVVRPSVSYTDQSFELRGWNMVGGYALQPEWGDGHNTGLYTYQYLRRIDPSRAA
jgi:DUF971 family protein